MKTTIALALALLLAGCGITQTIQHPPWAQEAWDRSNQGGGSAE